MKARAIQRNIHISSRKAALVCDLVRHRKVTEALIILEHTNKKIAAIIYKLLNQAIANATNNHAMNAEKLYIYGIVANQGHTLKRTSPRARGSADLIRKRHSHIEIILSDDENERKKDLEKIKLIQKNRAEKNKGHHAKQLEENKMLENKLKVISSKKNSSTDNKRISSSKKSNSSIKKQKVVNKTTSASTNLEKKVDNKKVVIQTKDSRIKSPAIKKDAKPISKSSAKSQNKAPTKKGVK